MTHSARGSILRLFPREGMIPHAEVNRYLEEPHWTGCSLLTRLIISKISKIIYYKHKMTNHPEAKNNNVAKKLFKSSLGGLIKH